MKNEVKMDLQSQVEALLERPSDTAVEAFFGKAIQALTIGASNIEVRPDASEDGTKQRGKGVFSSKSLKKGEVIFIERPLVAVQHYENKLRVKVCANCFRFLDSVEEQLRWSGVSSNECCDSSKCKLAFSEKFTLPKSKRCANACATVFYCSSQCQEKAWLQHHCILCPKGSGCCNTLNEECSSHNRMALFYEHSCMTNDVFLLASIVIARVLTSAAGFAGLDVLNAQTDDTAAIEHHQLWSALKKAWEPFSMGQKDFWWNCVALPDDVPLEEEWQFRDGLKELANESLGLLLDALNERVPHLLEAFPSVLQSEVWGSIIGMFELNNLSLVVANPVVGWAQMVQDGIESGEISRQHFLQSGCLENYAKLESIMEDEEGWMCDANAFYSIQSCINHSCCPNAHATKRPEDKDGSAVIIAQSNIEIGQEITISYIDEDASLNERCKQLRDYGFVCECKLCKLESDDDSR